MVRMLPLPWREAPMKKIEFDGYLLVYQADDSEGRWKGSYAILKDRAEITRGSLPLSAHSEDEACLLYTSPSPRDRQKSRMPSSA